MRVQGSCLFLIVIYLVGEFLGCSRTTNPRPNLNTHFVVEKTDPERLNDLLKVLVKNK
jgi:hypothetical protein